MCRGFTSSIVNDPLNLASIQCQCPTVCSLVRYIDDGAQAVIAGRGRGFAPKQGVSCGPAGAWPSPMRPGALRSSLRWNAPACPIRYASGAARPADCAVRVMANAIAKVGAIQRDTRPGTRRGLSRPWNDRQNRESLRNGEGLHTARRSRRTRTPDERSTLKGNRAHERELGADVECPIKSK